MDDLPARGPGGHVDRLAGLAQRDRCSANGGADDVVVLRLLSQSPPEVPFTVDQQVVKALARST
jgi:hypothetical protein